MAGRVFFRPMIADAGARPVIGSQRNMLGVRPGKDVLGANAGPGCGGLSVTADRPDGMPPGVLPRVFGGLNAETTMFETTEETFGPDTALALGPVRKKDGHAVVEADAVCSIDDFQSRLASTEPRWVLSLVPSGGV